MNRLLIAAVAATTLCAGTVMAQSGQASSKATAKVGDINVLNQTSFGWETILDNSIKTANQKDLFIDVSLECGLYTQTKVRSNGNKDTSSAAPTVMVQVLVDGVEAYPGPVTFCSRTQTLSATLGGILENCTDSNGDGDIDLNDCTLAPEEVELILETMNANSFNFILDGLEAGVHLVEVQAMISTSSSSGAGSASANATIGNGSVTVEEVRLIQNEDIVLD
jgi:hypothetical protein